MLDTLIFTAGITLPIFVMVFMGAVLKRIDFLNDNFVTTSSKLVFNLALPALIFLSMSEMDIGAQFNPVEVGYVIAVTLVSFFSSWLIAPVVVKERSDRGIFVQGAFRGNLAITGLALVSNMYGPPGVAQASLLMAFVVVLYNMLSVVILEFYLPRSDGSHLSLWVIVRSIARNPLIMAVCSGSMVAVAGLGLPDIVVNVGRYFSAMTLPLALIGIGATLDLQALRRTSSESFGSTIIKVVIIPLVATLGAIAIGIEGMTLGVIFLLFAAPTAAASFVMAQAIVGRGTLAANIVVLTTMSSVLTVSLGIFILKSMALV